MTLGQFILERRKALGWNQERLAEIVGVDRSAISLIESGRRSLTATTIVGMATALDVPVAELTELAAGFERDRRTHDESPTEVA
jgi:transcriptional regulator with XRE-family HTH domain